MRDTAKLDARPVVLQMVLEALLDRTVVAVLLHVDEVDDDQARKVAQAQLPGNFLGGFEVCVERRFLDRMLARRAS